MAERGALRGSRREPPPELPPGTRIAGYVVEKKLGAGGYSTVYLARGGDSTVALKVLPLESSEGREDRELDLLRLLKHPGVVRLLGYVDWPEDKPTFRALIMEAVDGLTVDTWARTRNPSALDVVEQLMLPLLEALGAAHAAGVVHRDVKASNILVRTSTGQAVLVDFGAGNYPGAPTLTTSVLPPGTREYRSPEAWDFFRRHVGEQGMHYQPTPADDLWALGIELYWLLTDRLPFTGWDFLAIGSAVLNETPKPPSQRNPWVPEELSRVCLRMLEKSPGARYADANAVREELTELLKAKADASWREPLFEPHTPHNATTRPMAGLAQDSMRRMARLARQRPRRGVPPPREETPAPGAGSPAQEPSPRAAARHSWWLPVLALAGLVLVSALWWVAHATQLFRSPEVIPTQRETFLQDVAPADKPPDGVGDAAREAKELPAPVINARHSENDMREKTIPRNESAPTQDEKAAPKRNGNLCLTLSVTAALAAGCAPSSLVQRAFIESRDREEGSMKEAVSMALECKPEWVENMKKKGIAVGSVHDTLFSEDVDLARGEAPPAPPVPTDVIMTFIRLQSPWGALEAGGLLGGKSVVIEDRIYSRLILYSYMRPGDPRRPTPVCMEVWHNGELGAPYLGRDPNNPRTGVLTEPHIQLKAVDQFH